jgi:hypothetical protein
MTRYQRINATENDIKQNRLGLMSQQQLADLQEQIAHFQQITRSKSRNATITTISVSVSMTLLAAMRIVPLPIALVIALIIIASVVHTFSETWQFIKDLQQDQDEQTVRIVRGRVSHPILGTHPVYKTLRVEVQTYRVADEQLVDQFGTGELYQLYVLPQSRLIIAAEKTEERGTQYLSSR